MATSKLGVSVSITIPITEGQLDHLRKLAKKRGKSPTRFVREIIKKHLKENPIPEPKEGK